MNWSNHGHGKDKWIIDHIIPCAAFDLTKPEDQQKCFHYTNIQPLWYSENARKSSRYNGKFQYYDKRNRDEEADPPSSLSQSDVVPTTPPPTESPQATPDP